ncbi:MAG TPA: LmeA family phospholipid-binding protein [Motilibacterales bacterium]|nr:LmeA family phospholipid-binding protein [Motilibacterales bacterium]
MKSFLLGVGATLAVLALGLVVLVASLGSDASGAEGAPASPVPTSPATAAPQPGDLADDETWLGAVELRSQDVISAEGDLVDLVATGSGVRFSQGGLTAQRLDIDATIPFATVGEQVGQDVTVYDAGNGKTGVERQVTILGRDITLRATGTVSADGGQLLIEPETVDLGGPSFLDSAASTLARSLVTIRQDVAGVPEGMSLTAVQVTPQGFDAQLNGADVVIGR